MKNKRICMVAYTFYEVDNRVRRYAEALASRGDRVDVVALSDPTSTNENCRKRYDVLNNVHIYRIQKRRINEKGKFSYLFRLVSFLLKSSWFLFIKSFPKKYDVIHVHSIPDFEVFAAVIPKILGTKIILDIHDIVPEFYASKFNVTESSFFFRVLIFLEKISIKFSNHLIIANDLWKEKLINRSVDVGKCSVYLNYPDQTIFHKRHVDKEPGKFSLIYPGTLNWHQGIDVAVKAVSLLKSEIPNIEFHIYGDGPEKLKILNLAKLNKIENKIILHPLIPLDEIADAIARADVGIVPKRKNSFGNEAFSTKIFEFLSVGIPVIAADTKIDKFYFKNEEVLFFESGNEKDLADKIRLLYNDKAKIENLKNNGFKCVQEYSWDVHKQRYFQLVDSL